MDGAWPLTWGQTSVKLKLWCMLVVTKYYMLPHCCCSISNTGDIPEYEWTFIPVKEFMHMHEFISASSRFRLSQVRNWLSMFYEISFYGIWLVTSGCCCCCSSRGVLMLPHLSLCLGPIINFNVEIYVPLSDLVVAASSDLRAMLVPCVASACDDSAKCVSHWDACI